MPGYRWYELLHPQNIFHNEWSMFIDFSNFLPCCSSKVQTWSKISFICSGNVHWSLSCNQVNDCSSHLLFVALSHQDMGTVILGKLESGCISKAQQLVMMPNRVRYTSIFFYHLLEECERKLYRPHQKENNSQWQIKQADFLFRMISLITALFMCPDINPIVNKCTQWISKAFGPHY